MMQTFILPHITKVPCKTVIKGQDARHISKVLRLKKGSTLRLTNGSGQDFSATVLTATPEQIDIHIFEQHDSSTESAIHITLCTGMLKDKKMDLVIKHVTQLGIKEWIPFFCDRSIPTPSEKRLKTRLDRWQTIAKESVKQCRRSIVPHICNPMPFADMLERAQSNDIKIVFWENAIQPLKQIVPAYTPKRIILLIGPEGGFADTEIQQATDKGFAPCSMGPRILRAETAAISGCTLLQHLFGDI